MTHEKMIQDIHATRRQFLRSAVMASAGAALVGGASLGAVEGAEEGAAVPVPDVNVADLASPEALIEAVYKAVEFGPDNPPNWAHFKGLFYPGARMGAVTPGGFRFTDVAGFTGGFEKARAAGSLTAFREWGLWQRVDRFGGMAQAFCTFESLANGEVRARGINAMQFILDHGYWWCVSIIWDRETENMPIPAEFL